MLQSLAHLLSKRKFRFDNIGRNSHRPLAVRLPLPFSQCLRSQQTVAVWLPKDSQTSCSDLRRLFERSALARREFRRTPMFVVSAGRPERFATRSFRGRWLQGTFLCLLSSGRHSGRAIRK